MYQAKFLIVVLCLFSLSGCNAVSGKGEDVNSVTGKPNTNQMFPHPPRPSVSYSVG
jgi:predicted small secreted protein